MAETTPVEAREAVHDWNAWNKRPLQERLRLLSSIHGEQTGYPETQMVRTATSLALHEATAIARPTPLGESEAKMELDRLRHNTTHHAPDRCGQQAEWSREVPDTKSVWVTNWVKSHWLPDGAWSGPYLLDRDRVVAGKAKAEGLQLYCPGVTAPSLPAPPAEGSGG